MSLLPMLLSSGERSKRLTCFQCSAAATAAPPTCQRCRPDLDAAIVLQTSLAATHPVYPELYELNGCSTVILLMCCRYSASRGEVESGASAVCLCCLPNQQFCTSGHILSVSQGPLEVLPEGHGSMLRAKLQGPCFRVYRKPSCLLDHPSCTAGHTASWGKGYPEVLTECYGQDGQKTGALGPLNPARNETYTFLWQLLREAAQVFPDTYVHLGGDEVPFDCWEVSGASVMCCGSADRCYLTPMCTGARMLTLPLTVGCKRAAAVHLEMNLDPS